MKKIFAVVLVICIACSTLMSANATLQFDVVPYGFKILWLGNELDFSSPVLLINGQTYVPLRDMSESSGMTVEWDGEKEEIRIDEANFSFEDVFSDTIGFNIPATADIVNYAYGRNGRDVSLSTKIFFKERDLAYMQSKLEKISSLLSEDEMEDETIELINMSKRFDWWDITSPKDAKYAYFGFMEGIEVTTFTVWALICEAPESDGYYLYISR